ncbi:histidine phosphatase family protein [Polaribacter sp. AHE13PA]|jgi:broad specificity phosphatase PhoE|uniref:SixA phosphatase family protein n=1 Tax=Polaribacter sp. AHE13PA TaxID=2745562 RepID=UPI001C4E498C|nr:phosphoglycerate mutase family protein [Polaribacter sp. AHE13PA]QXP67983.1 histidine phosphatase family protein [Polaribacter sp. AHE13PA]
MKKFLLLFVFAFTFITACSSDETTTYYLIRHAEKDRTNKSNRNPNLNKNGIERAEKWANHFKNVPFDAIYSTNYNRTIETATPTAEDKKLEILKYNPSKMYDSIFQQETKGKTVLIVGHSNTTPAFVNKILGEKKYEDIDDNNNANLYIVTISGDKKTSVVEKVE